MGGQKEKWLEDEARGVTFVRELIDAGMIDGAALGIAKLWIDKGDEALSDKQKAVLEEHVFAPHVTKSCSRCAGGIPWSEMLNAHRNGGYCGLCEHTLGLI